MRRDGGCPFFFQAEDGIRGPLVTGVQTCLFRSGRNTALRMKPSNTGGTYTSRHQWYPPMNAAMKTAVMTKNCRAAGSADRFQNTKAATAKTANSSANQTMAGTRAAMAGRPTRHQTVMERFVGSAVLRRTRTQSASSQRT